MDNDILEKKKNANQEKKALEMSDVVPGINFPFFFFFFNLLNLLINLIIINQNIIKIL